MSEQGQPLRLSYRQRAHEQLVHDAEEGGVRPDAEGQYEHSNGGEARVLQQLTEGEAKVVHTFERLPAPER